MAFQNVNQPTLSSRMHVLPTDFVRFLDASEIMLKLYCFKGSEPRWFRKEAVDEEKILYINIWSYDFIQNWRVKTYANFIRTCNVVRYTYYVLHYTVPVVCSTPYVDSYTFYFIRYTLHVMSQLFVLNIYIYIYIYIYVIIYTYM